MVSFQIPECPRFISEGSVQLRRGDDLAAGPVPPHSRPHDRRQTSPPAGREHAIMAASCWPCAPASAFWTQRCVGVVVRVLPGQEACFMRPPPSPRSTDSRSRLSTGYSDFPVRLVGATMGFDRSVASRRRCCQSWDARSVSGRNLIACPPDASRLVDQAARVALLRTGDTAGVRCHQADMIERAEVRRRSGPLFVGPGSVGLRVRHYELVPR